MLTTPALDILKRHRPDLRVGVIDGFAPKGVEGAEDSEKRRGFLRMIGYKR